MTVGLPGAEETFRILRRLTNLRPSKINNAPLCDARHLDWQVCGSELEAHRGYLRLDDDYLRVLTLKELPGETRPLVLNGLLDIPANFHVVTEWHPVDNAKARKEIASRRRHHHNSKTSFVSNLQDRGNTANQDNLVDDSKAAAVAELGGALTALGMEGKNFGELLMRIQQVTPIAGVTVRCMAGVGATPSCRIAASPSARSSLPPPALTRTNAGLNPVPDSVLSWYRLRPNRLPGCVLTQT
jgi:type IV secretion system protein VirB4